MNTDKYNDDYIKYMNELYHEHYSQEKNVEAQKKIIEEDKSDHLNIPKEPILSSDNTAKIRKRTIIWIMILALLVGYGGGRIALLGNNNLVGQAIDYNIISNGEQVDIASAVAQKAMPSVVGVRTKVVNNSPFYGSQVNEGVGTGVIVDANGYILTNSHVINDGEYYSVGILLYSGEELLGQVLWQDPIIDLAIIKVDATNLPVADLGDSAELIIGEMTFAIGNPLGFEFERTITQGIISGLNRSIAVSNYETIEGLIQTDASINPGNSGGPLLNKQGQVIGINTAKIQSGEGLGFAVPINIAKPIVSEFKEKGEFQKAYIGISGVNVERYLASYDDYLGVEQGVFVYKVFENSPADTSGLKTRDVILEINGEEIINMTSLINELYKYRPNDIIELTVVRDEKEYLIEVKLDALIVE